MAFTTIDLLVLALVLAAVLKAAQQPKGLDTLLTVGSVALILHFYHAVLLWGLGIGLFVAAAVAWASITRSVDKFSRSVSAGVSKGMFAAGHGIGRVVRAVRRSDQAAT